MTEPNEATLTKIAQIKDRVREPIVGFAYRNHARAVDVLYFTQVYVNKMGSLETAQSQWPGYTYIPNEPEHTPW